jgi:hypothetical protein
MANKMSKMPYGKPVKLLVDLQGYPDGRLVKYKVFRKTRTGEEKVIELNGVVRGNKALAIWYPDFFQGITFELDEKPNSAVINEKYYFIAKIDDEEVKSGDMEFTFPLTLFLKEGGEPLDGVKCKITFSDGTESGATFSRGFVKFNGVPLGRFTVEVNDYAPDTLYGVLRR